jgi:hypothetical protein
VDQIQLLIKNNLPGSAEGSSPKSKVGFLLDQVIAPQFQGYSLLHGGPNSMQVIISPVAPGLV